MRIGVDMGSVRVGLAASDPDGILASPVTVVRREPAATDTGCAAADLEAIAGLVADRDAVEVLVGRPRSLSGRGGPAERSARAYAADVAARVAPTPVRLVDERFSTVTASRRLRAAGRSARAQRPVVDAAAAAVLLQSALDRERTSGRPAGELVSAGPAGAGG